MPPLIDLLEAVPSSQDGEIPGVYDPERQLRVDESGLAIVEQKGAPLVGTETRGGTTMTTCVRCADWARSRSRPRIAMSLGSDPYEDRWWPRYGRSSVTKCVRRLFADLRSLAPTLLVLVSNREDLTADWVVLELERRGENFLRLCTEDYPTRIGVELEDGRAALRLDGRVLDASEVTAVWWRRSLAPIMPGTGDERREGWAAGEALVAWEAFWRTVEAHWVNRPEANVRASCKPIQLSLARRCGLRVLQR